MERKTTIYFIRDVFYKCRGEAFCLKVLDLNLHQCPKNFIWFGSEINNFKNFRGLNRILLKCISPLTSKMYCYLHDANFVQVFRVCQCLALLLWHPTWI